MFGRSAARADYIALGILALTAIDALTILGVRWYERRHNH